MPCSIPNVSHPPRNGSVHERAKNENGVTAQPKVEHCGVGVVSARKCRESEEEMKSGESSGVFWGVLGLRDNKGAKVQRNERVLDGLPHHFYPITQSQQH
jgi:hypothetical protein